MTTKTDLDAIAANTRTRPTDALTFADAIRLGSRFTTQQHGKFTDLESTACALTGAYLAVTAPQVTVS